MKPFALKLTDREFALARRLEAARVTTLSQAVKAMERGDSPQVGLWVEEMKRREAAR